MPPSPTNVAARRIARERLGLQAGAVTWPKHEHARRLRESGLFGYVREVQCHAEAGMPTPATWSASPTRSAARWRSSATARPRCPRRLRG